MTNEIAWYCRTCGWGAPIQTWPTRLGGSYSCGNCGRSGRISHKDAPVKVSSEDADLYWYELQNDETFQVPVEEKVKGRS